MARERAGVRKSIQQGVQSPLHELRSLTFHASRIMYLSGSRPAINITPLYQFEDIGNAVAVEIANHKL